MSLRGFEMFVEGKPAEELPRIVNAFAQCPWHHQLATNKGRRSVFRGEPHRCQETQGADADHLAFGSKILHFYFLGHPILSWDLQPLRGSHVIGLAKANRNWPGAWCGCATRQDDSREVLGQRPFISAGVVGGFSRLCRRRSPGFSTG